MPYCWEQEYECTDSSLYEALQHAGFTLFRLRVILPATGSHSLARHRYMHDPGPTGELARAGVLGCIAVANGEDPRVGRFVADHSPFCRLVVVWLCARYSDLPSKLRGGSEHDWRLLGAGDEPKIQACVTPVKPTCAVYCARMGFVL